jgi:hypothetical protein
VTAAATHGPQPRPDTSPQAIRAALLPEAVGEFDRDYRRALDIARETLSLDELHKTLEAWHRIAWSTQAGSEGHRRMLADAEQALRTGEPPSGSVPWRSLKAELGL